MRALQILLDPAAVTCTAKGPAPVSGTLATCTGPDGDVAARMVEQGWAFADRSVSKDYIAAENGARSSKAGAWRGTFLEPKAYRELIASVEAKYSERAGESARAEAAEALTTGKLDLFGLDGIDLDVAAAGGSPSEPEVHEIGFGGFTPGFIDVAIEPPDIFTWAAVAQALESKRQDAVVTVKKSVADTIFQALTQRPSQTVNTPGAGSFYAALKRNAAEWIAGGRQPVLYVKAQDVPNWIRDWFSGQPPAEAKITRRDGINNANYLGTIDGIDVYVGPGRDRASLLVPADILSGITYGRDDAGQVLTLTVDPAAGNAWTMRYGMALDWRDDQITWLAFPQMAAPTPDAG